MNNELEKPYGAYLRMRIRYISEEFPYFYFLNALIHTTHQVISINIFKGVLYRVLDDMLNADFTKLDETL